MAITSASLPAKKRILTVCVRLFLEKGYKRSTLAEIIEKADVSYSTFQNIFRAKDGVLTELVEFMFSNQFAMARGEAGAKLPPVYVYAVETAIQMTLTELNENLREIYIEAYTQNEASEYIFRQTAKELYAIYTIWCEENAFSPLKSRTVSDFLVGSAKKYGIEHSNNMVNAAGRRVWGFKGIGAVLHLNVETHDGWKTTWADTPFDYAASQ